LQFNLAQELKQLLSRRVVRQAEIVQRALVLAGSSMRSKRWFFSDLTSQAGAAVV
jgi:hypothetical protein